MNTCNNNPNKSCTTAKALHKPSGYSLLTSCSFDKSKNKPTYYRGKDCMKRFCDDLKKLVTRITNYEMQDSLSNLLENLSELKIKEVDKDVLIKRFYNTYQLSQNDINKFKLLLRKGVYPYEYVDSWKRLNELPSKDKFYSKLNLEDISDDDHAHTINVWNTFNISNLG